MVAASLHLLRDVVDEIIVAADARAAPEDLAEYASIADRVLRFEYAGPNVHWPWLAEQAGGDWIVVLDGDEVPGAALVDALPTLVRDRRINQYSLPIRWSWPDPTTFLAGEPWASDRRLRVLRNIPDLVFSARKHALAEPHPPLSYLDDLPVYHLDLLLADRAAREEKVRRYDREMFGLLTPEGLPFNQAFYLPEAQEDCVVSDTARADAESIRQILGARPQAVAAAAQPPVVSAGALRRHTPAATLEPEDYRADVRLIGGLPAISAGMAGHRFWVEVTNRGGARWPGGEHREPLIRLGALWTSETGPAVDAGRAFLPHPLEPGESAIFPVTIGAAPREGTATLRIDLVHEHVRWFGTSVDLEVAVRPSVEARLHALAVDVGDLLPLERVIGIRREIGVRDGLVRATSDAAMRPSDPHLAPVLEGLALGGWALDGETLDRLADLVRERRPRVIAEFGSGTSTVALAELLSQVHPNDGRVLSFEQDEAWAQRTRAALAERGLQERATVVVLPVGDVDGAPAGYALTDEAADLLRRHAPQMVLVDGPTLDSGGSRLGTLDLIAEFVDDEILVLLDDALRDAELCVAEVWARRSDTTVHGIRPTAKGLLEMTLVSAAEATAAPRAIHARLRNALFSRISS